MAYFLAGAVGNEKSTEPVSNWNDVGATVGATGGGIVEAGTGAPGMLVKLVKLNWVGALTNGAVAGTLTAV